MAISIEYGNKTYQYHKVKKLDPYSLQKWNWKKDEIVDPHLPE